MKIVIAIMFSILFCNGLSAEEGNIATNKRETITKESTGEKQGLDTNDSTNQTKGFRGLVWKTAIVGLKNMEYVSTDPSFGGIKLYRKTNDSLEIGLAKLSSIKYGFWDGRLCEVIVSANEQSNWYALKEAVFEKYSPGYKENRYIEKYFWDNDYSTMILEYNEIARKSTLWLSSNEMTKEMQAFNEGKAKKAAKSDF